MALALYRKYRPQSFGEVVGQEHVTEPLMAAIRGGRLNHAYLFSGPRGCGKTSSARILARSLNCVQGPTPEPCGECDSCVALAAGGPGSIDVIEIDAASHGGVDDARDLRERAVFAPVNSRYKVYVIDEAHMVSSAGFNALLKLVEEPPEYVVFVFATTEPDKVLPTIRSRTHHYPFRLIPPAAMRGLCQRQCESEGITVEDAVYPLVIRAGGGSARDTLSVLDQLIAGAGDEGVTYSRAVSLLGVTDAGLLDEMCDAFASLDGAGAMSVVDKVSEAGHDPRRFTTDLLERLRDLIVLNQVPDAASQGLIDVPSDVLERMTGQALRMGVPTLTRMAEVMHEALTAMRGTTAPRLLLELACARALLPAVDDTTAGLLQRLEQLEHRVADGVVAAAPGGQPNASLTAQAPSPPAPRPAAPAEPAASETAAPVADEPVKQPDRQASPQVAEERTEPAAPPEPAAAAAPPPVPPAAAPAPASGSAADPLGQVRANWERVKQTVKERKKTVAAFLMEATVIGVEDDTLVLSFRHSFHAGALQSENALPVFTAALHEVLGGKWKVRCEVGEPPAAAAAAPPPPAPAPTPAPAPEPAPAPTEAPAPPPAPPAQSAPPPADAAAVADEPPGGEEFDVPSPPQPQHLTMDSAVELFADRVGAKKI